MKKKINKEREREGGGEVEERRGVEKKGGKV